jgi:hypothetical protein
MIRIITFPKILTSTGSAILVLIRTLFTDALITRGKNDTFDHKDMEDHMRHRQAE